MDSLAPVFRALADPHRRLLLDRLFAHDGQTLGDLAAHLPEMTRFGAMKHIAVLEEAGLVTAQRVGREKRHYLNPVGIRLIHDRWISKYAAPIVGAISVIKHELEGEAMDAPAHVYTAWIRTTPERLWRAITDGADTERYYFGTRVASAWTPGARIEYFYPDGTIAADGEVLEVDEPRRLAMTFHARWDAEVDAAGPIRHVWAIASDDDGTCKLTVETYDLVGARAGEFTEGIAFIVSGLKTWLELGQPMPVG